ncbi:MAG: hypothetical protein ACLFP1_09035 [Candidatus Goldiibacteriota bacterium]
MMKRLMLLYTALLMAVFYLSCGYSDYVHLDYTVHPGAISAPQDAGAMFVASTSAYRRAEGAARFPDGGTPDYLLKKTALYSFDFSSGELNELADFSDLARITGVSPGRWDSRIAYEGQTAYYSVKPAGGWDAYGKTGGDKQADIEKLKEKYNKHYAVDILTKEKNAVPPEKAEPLYKKTKEISLIELNQRIEDVPMKEWGFVLEKIYPKPEEKYIDETIYLKNSSKNTRRAVIEQMISKKSRDEIKELLEKMDEHKNKLEGLKKTEYEIYSKDTYENIKSLVKESCEELAETAKEYLQAEEYVKADAAYRRAIDCDPENPALWNAFGEANYKAGRIHSADAGFTRAVELDPQYAPAWRNLCVMAVDNELYDDALKYIQKAVEIDEDDRETQKLFNKLKYELGMVTEMDP